MAILQLGEFIEEHDGTAVTIPIYERHFAVRLVFEKCGDDRYDRSYPASGSDSAMPARARQLGNGSEITNGRCHLESHPGPKLPVRKSRKEAAGHFLDSDPQPAATGRHTK